VFDAWQAVETKKRALEARQTYVRGLATEVRRWQSKMASLNAEAMPESLAQDAELKEVQTTAEGARTRVLGSLKSLLVDLAADNQVIEAALNTWMPTFTKVKEEYDTLLATIGGDRASKEAERKRLQDEKEDLEDEAKGFRELTQALPELLKTRSQLLDELERAYRGFYDVRKAKFDQLTTLSDGKLQLILDHAVDRQSYEEKLSDLVKGGPNAPSVADRRQIVKGVAPRRFVELVLNQDAHRLATEAEITDLWADRTIEKLWSYPDLSEVLALQHNCYPADVPTIKFRKEGNQYGPLNELSVGQKCTALLIIALCDGTMPIVIDQPEDALDVISVWEDIAKKLRRGKNSRQFILTTHDSTVAVSADSDQFIVLRAGATSGQVVFAGAIDREDVREAVIRHLEGGPEPYKLRSRKYNMT
jgi:predicted  nucleic acid-binding Zn-ribbon protein